MGQLEKRMPQGGGVTGKSLRGMLVCTVLTGVILPLFAAGATTECVNVYPQSFDVGGWSLDAQFMDTVGSPYLLAHGLGVRVLDESLSALGFLELDGLPAFAYDVEIAGDDPEKKLVKSAYFEGCNLGVGHEPNKGLTLLDIPKKELPEGKVLTIAVHPLSSLGTKGKPLVVTYSTASGSVRPKEAWSVCGGDARGGGFAAKFKKSEK